MLFRSWKIDALPTWLRFQPGVEPARRAVETRGGDDGPEDPLVVPELRGVGPDGAPLTLPGPWTLTRRRTGAQPKHVIEAEFGPHSHLS